MSYHFIFDSKNLNRFKYCPLCGNRILAIYMGDYGGFIECLECDEDIEPVGFTILEEFRGRFPKRWKEKFEE